MSGSYQHFSRRRTLDAVVRSRRLRREQRQRDFERRFNHDAATPSIPGLQQIGSVNGLLAAYHELRRDGGEAAGPDGVTFDDLDDVQAAAIFRAISQLIRNWRYRPGPARPVALLKPDGTTRTLKIRSIADRAVSKALLTALTPTLDPLLTDAAWAYRPRRGPSGMLDRVQSLIETQNRWVVVSVDIRRAFDNAPTGRSIGAIGRHINDDGVLWLTEAIIRGHEGAARQVGIDQGDPISPSVLNVLLDNVLDRPLLAAAGDIPYLRYSDNIVCLCRDVSEARRVLHMIRRLLESATFSLKGGSAPVDLRRQGAWVEILGFRLKRESDRVQYELTAECWWDLEQSLIKAHGTANPAKTARESIRGWVDAHQRAFGSAGETGNWERILYCAARYGYRESAGRDWRSGISVEMPTTGDMVLNTVSVPGVQTASVHGDAPVSVSLYPSCAVLRTPTISRSPQCDAEASDETGSVPPVAGSIQ